MEASRFEKGFELLEQIDGEAGKNVIDSLQDISPDLAKYTIEYPFGDIYARKGLDLKSREIATVAALTALGSCAPQLKVHLNAALNVGCNEEELKEVIIQMSVYAGFPAALNGMFTFKEVLAERTATHRC
ncbi:carboxymuconolactone decarboxylase family protein [Vibrio sp. EJY3]|uniref:carboxymuconolactone decarboxylase family protein n=1 Tax=Vibrio sp. (strain EJY3) TaxID=1116375 RepID=UPI000243B8BE|nr:carboxymuconolactone decarboxylase family protein [Vibrio sp. EJY3]AEX24922.1 4-carboxymuconolactone decarboxylase [Vibrio sp. EJY3]